MAFEYAQFEYFLSAALLVLAMFGMGTTLRPTDFAGIARAPQGILLIIALQVLVTPLLAIGLARVFSLPREIAVGMLLVAALPGGLFSNVMVFLGRGNVALSVSATAICTLGCLVTTTFVLKTFGSTQLPADFSMPAGRILSEIMLCLLFPLTLGMVFLRLWPHRARQTAKLCIRGSVVLLGLIIIGSATSGRLDVGQFGWWSPIAIVLFQVLAIWACYLFGAVVRLPISDSFAVAIEVAVRNAHLGVLLKASLFPASDEKLNPLGNGVLFVVLFYGVISLLIGGFEVFARRRGWGVHGRDLPASKQVKAEAET